MSQHVIPAGINSRTVAELSIAHLRAASVAPIPQANGSAIIIFVPDLTVQETATLEVILRLAAGQTSMTPTQYSEVRTQMQTLRDLRQLGRNAFMALTATERDRLLYDAAAATTTVLLAILRD